MKTIKEVITKSITKYQCDLCDFSAERDWVVSKHEAETHLDIKVLNKGSFTLYRALDKNTLKRYIRDTNHGADVSVAWDGPGWYVISSHHEDRDKNVTFFIGKAEAYMSGEKISARRLIDEIEELEQTLLETDSEEVQNISQISYCAMQ